MVNFKTCRNLMIDVSFVNVTSLNILVQEVINLLYYEHWKDKAKYCYARKMLDLFIESPFD